MHATYFLELSNLKAEHHLGKVPTLRCRVATVHCFRHELLSTAEAVPGTSELMLSGPGIAPKNPARSVYGLNELWYQLTKELPKLNVVDLAGSLEDIRNVIGTGMYRCALGRLRYRRPATVRPELVTNRPVQLPDLLPVRGLPLYATISDPHLFRPSTYKKVIQLALTPVYGPQDPDTPGARFMQLHRAAQEFRSGIGSPLLMLHSDNPL